MWKTRLVEWRGDEMRYVIYGDDSGSSDKRYRCLTLVSSSPDVAQNLSSSLATFLVAKQVSELKFEEVRGHPPKMQVAEYFIEQAVDYCFRRKLRIDTLLWDTQDSRHAVRGRDDEKNNQVMYYKNLVHVARQWNISSWRFFPDEQAGVDWNELRSYLNNTRLRKSHFKQTSLLGGVNPFLDFEPIENQDSAKHSLIQLADFFGGLSRFSREKCCKYFSWLLTKEAKEHPGLFIFEGLNESSDSTADRARFSLLRQLDQACKKVKMGISLKTRRYLWSPKPESPMNFWNYEPAHELDKAPISARRFQ